MCSQWGRVTLKIKNSKIGTIKQCSSFISEICFEVFYRWGGEEADLRVWQQRFISGNIPVNLFFLSFLFTFSPPPPPGEFSVRLFWFPGGGGGTGERRLNYRINVPCSNWTHAIRRLKGKPPFFYFVCVYKAWLWEMCTICFWSNFSANQGSSQSVSIL